MENIEQLLSRLEARYGNPEADFMARAGTMQDFGQDEVPIPVAEEPEPRIQADLEIHTEADWDEATAKLKDVQSLSAYISQSSYKDREILLKMLRQYTETIDRKMVFPEEEEDQCAEIWLGKAQDILKKRFNTLRNTVHRMKQMPIFQQGLQQEIQKYFEGIGMHERPFREGDTIVGQEEWFEIWTSKNNDAERDMKIKEIEMQPYYMMYRDNEEEDEEAIKRFIFPGRAWVYEKKKEV